LVRSAERGELVLAGVARAVQGSLADEAEGPRATDGRHPGTTSRPDTKHHRCQGVLAWP
jgi:hypothetical protein